MSYDPWYLILEAAKVHLYAINPWRYIGLLAVLTYLVECLIFLLKGWSMSMRGRQKGLWMLLWGICFVYCFVLPVWIAKSMIFYGFKPAPPHPVDTLNVVSWIAVFLAIRAAACYSFLTRASFPIA